MLIKISKNIILTLLVFILAFSIRLYWISQKQGFHLDEISSKYVSVGLNDESYNLLSTDSKVFNAGSFYKNFFFGKPKHSLKTDLSNIRKNNYKESAHPNLYFYILRTASEFTDFSPKSFKFIGCLINMVFFVFSFIIMRKILIRLFGDNKLVPIGLAIAFLNTGALSMTLFVRPYEMQTTSFLLLSYIFLIIDKKLSLKQNIKKDCLYIIPALSFALLSGYYLILYISILGLILLWHCRKEQKTVLYLILSVFSALLITLIVYPGYFSLFNCDWFAFITTDNHYSEEYFWSKIFVYLKCLIYYLFYGLIILIALIFGFDYKKNEAFEGKYIITTALLWSVIVEIISPFGVVRYIFPSLPILSILLLYFIQNIQTLKYQQIAASLIIAVYIASALFPFKMEVDEYNIKYNNRFSIPFAGKINNLFSVKLPELDPQYKVIVKSFFWFEPLFIISTLNNNQKYSFILSDEKLFSLVDRGYQNFYLLTKTNLPYFKNYDVEQLDNYLIYKCYKLTKKETDE